MEATNISIKQQSSVSINVETLQAIIQRALSAVAARPLDACTARNFSLLPIGEPPHARHTESGAFVCSRLIGDFTVHFSLIRLYRHELRLARAVARVIDAHPTISNILLWLMGIGIMVEIFLFV